MERRDFILKGIGLGLSTLPVFNLQHYNNKINLPDLQNKLFTGPREPVFIYNNWSAYDELSDKVSLTENLAMKELLVIMVLAARWKIRIPALKKPSIIAG